MVPPYRYLQIVLISIEPGGPYEPPTAVADVAGPFLGRTTMKIDLCEVVVRREAACDAQKIAARRKLLIFDVFPKASRHVRIFNQF